MTIRTVQGDIPTPEDGVILMHEHLYCDMATVLDDVRRSFRDVELVSTAVIEAKSLGLRLIVDATPVEIGRNVWALRDVAERTGIPVVASSGRYRQLAMPASFGRTSADALTDLICHELLVGIEGSGIRAGLIGEVGTDNECFTEGELVSFVAAAVAQSRLGAPLLTHTPDGRFGVEQAKVLIAHGADPSRICIGHLDCAPDLAYYEELIDLGVWLGLDRAGSGRVVPDTLRFKVIEGILARGWQDRLLISGDVASESRIRSGRGYAYSFTDYWRGVVGTDVRDELYRQVFCVNPGRFLSWSADGDNS